MHRQRRRAPRAVQAGFTLIEIILVVVLIGAIVAFAASRLLGGRDNANVKLTHSQVTTLADKISRFEMDTGQLPASLQDLVQSDAQGWLGPYAKEGELKDAWGTPYDYKVPGDNQPFDLISYGADKKPGGKSVDADIKFE
nr:MULTISPECIES: type II secretion system major pseudopilin GspG [Lysobacter]